ncbi:MAG: hypothetical protein K0R73_1142 [Candidatus Midichloriaceae bacterium]|jgi:hypothetical protein|nr:hypothetical protein [Candidatus Midichloriaceae bacterium]
MDWVTIIIASWFALISILIISIFKGVMLLVNHLLKIPIVNNTCQLIKQMCLLMYSTIVAFIEKIIAIIIAILLIGLIFGLIYAIISGISFLLGCSLAVALIIFLLLFK